MGAIVDLVRAVVGVKPPPGYSTGRMVIAGVVAAAYAERDALGSQWEIPVPRKSRLQSATLWDLSDQNLQVNLTIADRPFDTKIADNAPFALSDDDALKVVYQVEFIIFTDWVNNRASFVDQIGKRLTFPDGVCYLQAFVPGAPTIAAGALPVVQLEFEPDE